MAELSREEIEALSHASGNAAIEQALSLLKTDREAVRAAHWNGLPEKTRQLICHMSGLPAEKGKCALRTLDALERGKINRTAARLIRDLEILIRCAQGGDMPTKGAAIPHAFNGIAAPGVVQ